MLNEFAAQVRYAPRLARFLRRTLTLDEARAIVRDNVARREESFLYLLEHSVYANPKSPYRKLLLSAGIEIGDLTELVRAHGLEGALGRLYDAGVHVTYEEFRGRAPIRRNGLEFAVKESDFYNPLLAPDIDSRTSGSRGTARRVVSDLNHIQQEAAAYACLLAAHGLSDSALAVWQPMPPGTSGMRTVFRQMKIGKTPERWFTQGAVPRNATGLAAIVFLLYTLAASRVQRRPVPVPKFVRPSNAVVVAGWLAEKRAQGRRGLVDTSTAAAISVCLAAREHGLDISGSILRTGGEAYTMAKEQVIASVGARALQGYGMAELGMIGMACASPTVLDDLHLGRDRMTAICREKRVGPLATVPALVFTTVARTSSPLMLNVVSGDYGRLEDRDCGCPLSELGFQTHISGLHAYDKLMSDTGVFIGSELYQLVEDVLPARFGGHPTDYQLVEQRSQGPDRMTVVVAPSVGDVDENAVLAAVREVLDKHFNDEARPADPGRQGLTLQILRREPYRSGGRKILPLHVLAGSQESR